MMRDLFEAPARPAPRPVVGDPVGKFVARMVDGKLDHPCFVCGVFGPFGVANGAHEFGLWACGRHRAQVEAMR